MAYFKISYFRLILDLVTYSSPVMENVGLGFHILFHPSFYIPFITHLNLRHMGVSP